MTLSPTRELGRRWEITSFGGTYELPRFCEKPYCGDPGWTEAHHVVPRSRTAGPKDWIVIDGFNVRNKIRVCKTHHDHLTGGIGGHKAKITWDGGWAWWDQDSEGGWSLVGWINDLSELQSASTEGAE